MKNKKSNFIKKNLTTRKIIALFILSLLTFLLIMEVSPERFFSDSLQKNGIRLIKDNYDRTSYAYYGLWGRHSIFPYSFKKWVIDMPQIATLIFGLLWFFSSSVSQYMVNFSILMLLVTVMAFIIYLKWMREQNVAVKWPLLMWLNPIMFYFYLNRFDMIVILLFFLSIELVMKDHPLIGGIFYALSILTKWFPALCFIPLILYAHKKHNTPLPCPAPSGGMIRVWWKNGAILFISSFCLSIALIFLLTFIGSGWDGLLMPYRSQGGRFNNESLYYFLTLLKGDQKIIYYLFHFLQVIPAIFLPFFVKKYDYKNLFMIITIIIMNFILFCPVNSPQWIQWFLPFLLLVVRKSIWIPLILILQILTYMYFPLFLDIYGVNNVYFQAVIITRIALMAVIEIILINNIISKNSSQLLAVSD